MGRAYVSAPQADTMTAFAPGSAQIKAVIGRYAEAMNRLAAGRTIARNLPR